MTSPVDLVYIIDRSGSMANLITDAVGGFNTFVETQKELPGEAYLTLVAFNDQYEVVYDRVPLADVPTLSATAVSSRGSTALLDAIGKTIGRFQADWRVMFTIMTDGYENMSKEFTKSTLKTLVEARTAGGWEFSFVGAGVDNFADAQDMGFTAKNILQTSADTKGVSAYTASFSTAARVYRSF
jgi:uncharacterized protein YegL